MNWREVRVGEIILGERSDPSLLNHVRSGFRVVSVEENGLKVQRIHAVYLNDQNNPWVIRWDQLENSTMQLVLEGQLPLL